MEQAVLDAIKKAVAEGQAGAVPYAWAATVVGAMAGVIVTLFLMLMSEKKGRLEDASKVADEREKVVAGQLADYKQIAVTLDRATEALKDASRR